MGWVGSHTELAERPATGAAEMVFDRVHYSALDTRFIRPRGDRLWDLSSGGPEGSLRWPGLLVHGKLLRLISSYECPYDCGDSRYQREERADGPSEAGRLRQECNEGQEEVQPGSTDHQLPVSDGKFQFCPQGSEKQISDNRQGKEEGEVHPSSDVQNAERHEAIPLYQGKNSEIKSTKVAIPVTRSPLPRRSNSKRSVVGDGEGWTYAI